MLFACACVGGYLFPNRVCVEVKRVSIKWKVISVVGHCESLVFINGVIRVLSILLLEAYKGLGS